MKSIHASFSRADHLFILATLFLGVIPHAHAWNSPGHMLVANIAWLSLAPAVRNTIRGILAKARGNFTPLAKGDDAERDAFDFAATLPDVIRSKFIQKTKIPTSEYEPLVDVMNKALWNGKPPSNTGEDVRCKSWHFYDAPLFVPKGGTPLPIAISNLTTAWTAATTHLQALKKGKYKGPKVDGFTNDDLKFWWMAWMLHLAGDAHQPLHCAANYTVSPVGDHGGNWFFLSTPPSGEIDPLKIPDEERRKLHNLHSYWDELLVTCAHLDGFSINLTGKDQPTGGTKIGAVAQAWLKDKTLAPTAAQLADTDITRWVTESTQHAKDTVYKGAVRGSPLSKPYGTKAQKLGRPLAVLAGKRLAIALEIALK